MHTFSRQYFLCCWTRWAIDTSPLRMKQNESTDRAISKSFLESLAIMKLFLWLLAHKFPLWNQPVNCSHWTYLFVQRSQTVYKFLHVYSTVNLHITSDGPVLVTIWITFSPFWTTKGCICGNVVCVWSLGVYGPSWRQAGPNRWVPECLIYWTIATIESSTRQKPPQKNLYELKT